jgi:hypothetical protein
MPPDSPVEFLYSDACDVQQALFALQHCPEIARMARREYWIVVGSSLPWGLLIGGIVGFVITGLSTPNPPWPGLVAGAVVALLVTFYNGRRKVWADYHKSIVRFAAYTPRGPSSDAKVTITVGREGITSACDGVVTTYGWSHFERVIKAGPFICVLFVGDWHGISVPVSAFATGEEAAAWQEWVQGIIDSNGFGPGARVRGYLESHDVRCGECGHPLRGLRDPKCTECGTELFLGRLTAWAALAVPVRDWWFARQQ